MKRRDILRYTAYVTGAAITAPIASTFVSGCKLASADEIQVLAPKFFKDPDDMKLLYKIVDTILPATDSPSATDVGVPEIIDNMVGEVYSIEDQNAYRAGFDVLAKYINDQDDALGALEALEANDASDLEAEKKAYLQLKQQTVAYYLSTEEIGTNYLNYLPVPGAYNGCISLEEAGGKAWAI